MFVTASALFTLVNGRVEQARALLSLVARRIAVATEFAAGRVLTLDEGESSELTVEMERALKSKNSFWRTWDKFERDEALNESEQKVVDAAFAPMSSDAKEKLKASHAARSEAEKARSETLRQESLAARTEAEKAQSETLRQQSLAARTEADKARSDVVKAQSNAQRLQTLSDRDPQLASYHHIVPPDERSPALQRAHSLFIKLREHARRLRTPLRIYELMCGCDGVAAMTVSVISSAKANSRLYVLGEGVDFCETHVEKRGNRSKCLVGGILTLIKMTNAADRIQAALNAVPDVEERVANKKLLEELCLKTGLSTVIRLADLRCGCSGVSPFTVSFTTGTKKANIGIAKSGFRVLGPACCSKHITVSKTVSDGIHGLLSLVGIKEAIQKAGSKDTESD